MPPPSSAPSGVWKDRWLGFLIWQSIVSTFVYLLASLLLGPSSASSRILPSLLSFLSFHLAMLLFSFSLFFSSSPQPEATASLPELAAGALRSVLRLAVGGFRGPAFDPSFRRRAGRATRSVSFVALSGVAGFLAVVSLCGDFGVLDGRGLVDIGVRGLVLGLVFGCHYSYTRRWVLQFPIIQRPLFFSYKVGLSSSLKQAVKHSTSAFISSALLMIFLSDHSMGHRTAGQFIKYQTRLLFSISAVSLCWEIIRHLLEVLHTRRCILAPHAGSSAAETNPSGLLLDALEQSVPRSFFQYLAYLDLSIVAESNAELWRRAAFYEESGDTYRRVMSICLRPLEQLTSRLAVVSEGLYPDKSNLLSLQPHSKSNVPKDEGMKEVFNDFQLCEWCVRTAAALTARSHQEDAFGVAQITGSNATVMTTLLACLLAVELCMGKKPTLQSVHQMGPASIKWAALQTGNRDTVASVSSKRKNGAFQSKAFAMADILRTSIYHIISAFEPDMLASTQASALEKNWITESKPLLGTKEMLLQKLTLFLDFRAN